MSRRAWTWGTAVFAVGLVIVIGAAHAMSTYQAPAGSTQTTTLGQVGSLIVGGALTIIGGLVLGTGCRRRLEIRRRRRLRDRLAERGN